MPIHAGRLRDRVTFLRPTVTSNDHGEDVVTGPPMELGTRWAEVRHGTGQERREAAQEAGSVTATFLVRADSVTRDVGVTDSIRFEGSEWDIASNVPTIDRDGREIVATRRV